MLYATHNKWDIAQLLGQCWASVVDSGQNSPSIWSMFVFAGQTQSLLMDVDVPHLLLCGDSPGPLVSLWRHNRSNTSYWNMSLWRHNRSNTSYWKMSLWRHIVFVFVRWLVNTGTSVWSSAKHAISQSSWSDTGVIFFMRNKYYKQDSFLFSLNFLPMWVLACPGENPLDMPRIPLGEWRKTLATIHHALSPHVIIGSSLSSPKDCAVFMVLQCHLNDH